MKTHGFEPWTFPLKVGHSTNRVLLSLLLYIKNYNKNYNKNELIRLELI